jgi:glycosyltransferase involved in cell wall biosynthesis
VCTNCGGPTEYVDMESGYVVDHGDCRAMADRIRTLLLEPAVRWRMSRAARYTAEQKYGYGRMIADYIRVYEEVVARTPLPAASRREAEASGTPRGRGAARRAARSAPAAL